MGRNSLRFTRRTGTAACAALGVALCGCTVLMVDPPRPSVDDIVQGLTWQKAMEYLDRARTNMKDGQSHVDQLNQATLGGVAVGVGGAAIATLARGSAGLVLGLLALGGTSHSVNQVSIPQVQSEIYAAGLRRLACIEEKAYLRRQSTAGFARAFAL